jgi:hypothetical protein
VLDLKDCFGQSPRNDGFVVLGGDVLMAARANVRELKAESEGLHKLMGIIIPKPI